MALGPSPAAVLSRDLDGDGHLDLLAAHAGGGGTVALLRGDGAGHFERWTEVPAGENPAELAFGDFDEDGHVDLAVANHEARYLTLLFGTGDGGFARDGRSRLQVEVEPHTHTVAVGDVDEDGHLDLLVDHRRAGALRLLVGAGDGTFRDAGVVAVGGDPYRWVSLTDRDGDGHLDLAVPLERSVALLRGTGESVAGFALWLRRADGSYRRAPGAPFELATGPMRAVVGELNGDGRPDFLVTCYVGSEVGLLLSERDGFEAVRRAVWGNPYGAAIGDFDEDGRPDFVTTDDGSGDLSVFLRVGDGP